jgi:hypothetical protein
MKTSKNVVAKMCRAVLDSAWIEPPGYTAPNRKQYPWQWLWDSCFHAIARSGLGDSRCVTELENLFAGQLESGFLPNMLYATKPWANFFMWWHRGHSTITQPPMYGHALKVLKERGFQVEHLFDPATRAINYLIESRMDQSTGLVKVVHPWETGCDDSPRWARWMPFGYHRRWWNITKFVLVRSMRLKGGGAEGNPLFEVCSASFNALVAFNALELAELTGDTDLARNGLAIARQLKTTWLDEEKTWADVRPGTGTLSSSMPTQQDLMPLLVVDDQQQLDQAWAQLMDESVFNRPHGFAGVSATSSEYRSSGYWRGGCWPQLCYLLFIAAQRQGRPETEFIREKALQGMVDSNLSEYWDAEDGVACGAKPQSWSAIAIELSK